MEKKNSSGEIIILLQKNSGKETGILLLKMQEIHGLIY